MSGLVKYSLLYFLLTFFMQNIFACAQRAAYKGFADSIRLLLFLDVNRGRRDKEGNFHQIVYCFFNFFLSGIIYDDFLLCK